MIPPDIYREGLESSRSSLSERDKADAHLLTGFEPLVSQKKTYRNRNQQCQTILYATIAVQFVALVIAVVYIWNWADPTLAIWCKYCFALKVCGYGANQNTSPRKSHN